MSSLIDQLLSLNNKYVTIGIHGDKGEQKKIVRSISARADLKNVRAKVESSGAKIKGRLNRHRLDPNLTVATVAAWNEFGNKRIPERSFLRSVLRDKRSQILTMAKRALLNKPDQVYEIIGQYILNEINRKIVSGVPPPNKPKTIERKGSSKPLVDTGQLKAALTFKVSEK